MGRAGLLIVDMQNDFIPGSYPGASLTVPGAESCVAGINAIRIAFKDAGGVIAHTQDSHPADHCSFYDNHHGAEMFSIRSIPSPDGGKMDQVMWPRHCVKGSRGHEFHDHLVVETSDLIQPKGRDPAVDSYSGFFDNLKGRSTGLADRLQAQGVTHLFVVGVAYDFCAGSSAIDGASCGFKTYIIENLTASVGADTAAAMKEKLAEAGVVPIAAADVQTYLRDVGAHDVAPIGPTKKDSIDHSGLARRYSRTSPNFASY